MWAEYSPLHITLARVYSQTVDLPPSAAEFRYHQTSLVSSETFSSSTIQVQTVETMEAGRVSVLVLQFQPVLALTASPHTKQEVQLLVLGLQSSQLTAQTFVHKVLHYSKTFFFAADTDTSGRQQWASD